ncbi:MAG: hypothetical protein AABX27_04995 [Nanoarchaeota archaeon]
MIYARLWEEAEKERCDMVLIPGQIKALGQEQKKERISGLEKELEDDIDRVLAENQDRLKYIDNNGKTHYGCINYYLSRFCITNSNYELYPEKRGEKIISAGILLADKEREGIIKRVGKKYETAGWLCYADNKSLSLALPEYKEHHDPFDCYYNPD